MEKDEFEEKKVTLSFSDLLKARNEIERIRKKQKIIRGIVLFVCFFIFNGTFIFFAWFMGMFAAIEHHDDLNSFIGWTIITVKMSILTVLYILYGIYFTRLLKKLANTLGFPWLFKDD